MEHDCSTQPFVTDSEFRRLQREHQMLEVRLGELDRQKYLTEEEQMERKLIQKKKLQRKDRMEEIRRSYLERSITA